VADPAHLPDDVLAEVLAPFSTADARLALARAGIGLSPASFAKIGAPLFSMDVLVRSCTASRTAC
jgi:hypothetical protein